MALKLLLRGTLGIPKYFKQGIFPAWHRRIQSPQALITPALTSDAREWRNMRKISPLQTPPSNVDFTDTLMKIYEDNLAIQ